MDSAKQHQPYTVPGTITWPEYVVGHETVSAVNADYKSDGYVLLNRHQRRANAARARRAT